MRVIWKLAFAYLREHPLRLALSALAIAASICMVVWVATSYDSLLATFDDYSSEALGSYHLTIAPVSVAAELEVPAEAVGALAEDPAVRVLDPIWWAETDAKNPAAAAAPQRPQRGGPPRKPRGFVLLGMESAAPPFALKEGRWLDPAAPEADEAVLSVAAAKRLEVALGGEISAGKAGHGRTLRVVGLMDSPTVTGVEAGTPTQLPVPAVGEILVSRQMAEALSGGDAKLKFLGVGLKEGADLTAFRFGWGPRLARFSVPVHFQEAHDIEEALDESASARNVQMQAYASCGIAMLVALLVILSSLNMGVSERVRQLAILRAVRLTKGQVRMLVAVEGLMLATVGLLGGLAGGWLLLRFAAGASGRLFKYGVLLGNHTLVMALAAAYGGALLALWIPAWRATRMRPVDVMAARPREDGGKALRMPALVTGLALIALNPALAFLVPRGFDHGVTAAMALGFLAMAAGFVLIAPAVVALADRLLAPALARLLGIRPKLLESQITANLWRTVGAAVSLTVGLGLYVGVQVWGFTMLEAFVPGKWAPDALISFNPGGISPSAAEEVAKIPGVDPQRCLPVVVEQPRMVEDLTGSAKRASVTRQDNVVMLGVDPQRAFGGENPLLKLEWVAGTPQQAVEIMAKGRACVVPDHFLNETGLKPGDSFELIPPDKPTPVVRYTIAGAVRLPGWHWLTKHTGFRPRSHRAAALMFGDFPSVSADFGLPRASHVWFNYASPDVNPDDLAAPARDILARELGREVAISSAPDDGPYVRVMTADWVRDATRAAARQWLWLLGWMPLVAFGISLLGVLNVTLASVRARSWEMGVLRTIGHSRSALARSVIAEGALIGAVACVLSLGFGVLGGWCGCGYAQNVSFFGGLNPPLTTPWKPILLVLASALALSAFAAVWPAVAVGRAKPLDLLGRGGSNF